MNSSLARWPYGRAQPALQSLELFAAERCDVHGWWYAVNEAGSQHMSSISLTRTRRRCAIVYTSCAKAGQCVPTARRVADRGRTALTTFELWPTKWCIIISIWHNARSPGGQWLCAVNTRVGVRSVRGRDMCAAMHDNHAWCPRRCARCRCCQTGRRRLRSTHRGWGHACTTAWAARGWRRRSWRSTTSSSRLTASSSRTPANSSGCAPQPTLAHVRRLVALLCVYRWFVLPHRWSVSGRLPAVLRAAWWPVA